MTARGSVSLDRARALRHVVLAQTGMTDLITDAVCEFTSVMHGDHRLHHIERSRSTRTGHAVAVDHINAALNQQRGIGFKQCFGMFPMGGHAPVLHEAGARQNHGTGGYTAEHDAATGQKPQPAEHALIVEVGQIAPSDNQNEIEINRFTDIGRGTDFRTAGAGGTRAG